MAGSGLRSRWIVVPLLVVVVMIFCSMVQLALLTTENKANQIRGETNNEYDSIYQRRGIDFIVSTGLDFGARLQDLATASEQDMINAQLYIGQHASCMAIVDPVISRRLLNKLRVPLVPALYEAAHDEWNSTEMATLFNRSCIQPGSVAKALAVRQAQSQRLLPPYIHSDELMMQTPLVHRIAASSFTSTPDPGHWASFVEGILDEDLSRFSQGASSITDAPRGVIVEELYTMPGSTPPLPSFLSCEAGGSSCEPLILEVNMIFGYTYILQVRDSQQRVAYWALRNGTTSFNTNETLQNEYVFDDRAGLGGGGTCTCPDGQRYDVGDAFGSGCQSLACDGGVQGPCSTDWVQSEHEFNSATCRQSSEVTQFAFVEKVVLDHLSDILFHSERTARALGASWLTARWLIGSSTLGPRLHDLKFFWYQGFSLNSEEEESFMSRVIEDLRKGFRDRRDAKDSQRVASILETTALGHLGCTKTCEVQDDGSKECSAECGGQNYDAAHFLDQAAGASAKQKDEAGDFEEAFIF